jgi:uridylate kinase
MSAARYGRILVKLSGEALLGDADYGIDPAMIKRVATELTEVIAMGSQVAVVLGGAISSAARTGPGAAWIVSLPTRWACWQQS